MRKPGSCAREGQEPPRPAKEGSPQLQESRYERHGALNLFAGLSVADGKVYQTFQRRKRFVDFQSFVEQILIPEALARGMHTVNIIVDNGSTHAPKQLEAWLHHLPIVQEGKLTFHVFWLPTNASWLDQIEIWFSILQRKCLQPNHFGSLPELEQAITDFVAYYNQQAKPIKWTYTSEQLEKKLEQRRKQEAQSPTEQKRDPTINSKAKEQKEHKSKDQLKPTRGHKPENSLTESKSLQGERRADQNSDRISA